MKRLLLIFLFLCYLLPVSAQDGTVRGVIRDETNQPIPGVTVREKGTSNVTVSAANGTYRIKVKAGASLQFRYLGFKPQERKVGTRTTIDVTLQDDINTLNEVVVVGYGQKTSRKELTGSISSVSGQELASVPVQNVAQALQGRVAGLQVTTDSGEPGEAPKITIRGGTSISQSNEPLYVVDGVPQTDGLNFLDPTDIESIDALKDAASTALYGARGANGVILVTTRGAKSGKTTLNYEGYIGVRKISKYLPVLTPLQYVNYIYEGNYTDPTNSDRLSRRYGTYDTFEQTYGNRPGIDWQKETMGETAMSQYHKFSIAGGKETKYNLFYSRNINDGLLKYSGANKDIAKLMITNAIGKKAVVTGIVNYSSQYVYGSGGTEYGGNARLSMLQNLLQYRPVSGKDDNDFDLINDTLDEFDDPGNPAFQSPLIAIRSRQNQVRTRSLNANVTARYNITKKITYNGLVSFTNQFRKTSQFITAENITALRTGGPSGSISEDFIKRLSYNNVINYSNTFSKVHKLDVAIGQEYLYNYREGFGASASRFPVANNGIYDLGAGTVPGFPSSFAEDDKMFSLFTRANYSYKRRYLFSASLRRDGSSKFGSENLYGYFPAASAAWRIIEEPFMKASRVFSDLKLRVSYGTSGNNRIANYAALGVFGSGYYGLGNQVVPTVSQLNLSNPFLKWETVVQKNIGLDLGLFKQRITLTAEVYENLSKDLLYNSRIPASTGFTTQLRNIGKTSSRGVELTLNTANIRNKDFSWNTNLNLTINRTKVLQLNGSEDFLLSTSFSSMNDYILKVGQPVGVMYGYLSDGLYQPEDFDYNESNNTYRLKTGVLRDQAALRPGYAKYKDLSGPDGTPDNVIDDYDRTIIGNANPKLLGGINNTFKYKNIDLGIFLNFSLGNDIYNGNLMQNLTRAGDFNSSLAYHADRFTYIDKATGTVITDQSQLAAVNKGKTKATINGYGNKVSDRVIEDGSFLRINNVNLGYTLPQKWIKAVKLSNARVYLTAYNLHVFTKYSGYDPEVSVLNNPLARGLDFSAYPRGRFFVAGINVSL